MPHRNRKQRRAAKYGQPRRPTSNVLRFFIPTEIDGDAMEADYRAQLGDDLPHRDHWHIVAMGMWTLEEVQRWPAWAEHEERNLEGAVENGPRVSLADLMQRLG